jgi:hypothetical protein
MRSTSFVTPLRSLRRGAVRAALVAAAVAAPATGLAVTAAPASAAKTMVTSIADDGVLNRVHGDPAPIVAKWKAAGVQNVRMFAQWSHIAPSPDDTRPPEGFDGKAEGAYSFEALDRKIDLVRENGMTVTLVVTGPGPVWGSLEPARRNARWRPSPAKFGDFATAVAKHTAERVDDYIVWNEPNVATWLQPQNVCSGSGKCRVYAPHLYRKLADAGYRAIRRADPDATIAIGATSSKGDQYTVRTNSTTQPLVFLRTLACVNSRYKRITTGDCRGFKAPQGNVLAYHPHSSKYTPGYRSANKDDARMGDLSRLTSVVDKLTKAGRLKVVGAKRFPFWFDEYAYETNPPETVRGVSLTAQASWSQWGWWTAWRHPRVQLLTQYEWFDEGEVGANDPSGWQSGLHFAGGKAKPIAQAFPNPIFGYRTSRTGSVWGQVRTATGRTKVTIQRASGGTFRNYKTATTDARGTFTARVPKSSGTKYRYTYVSPVDGETKTSLSTTLRKR